MSKIIGRKQEQQELERLYHSHKAEFVAVYGRRRVGKTFLIREMFKDRMTFYHTGLSPLPEDNTEQSVDLSQQLHSFYISMIRYGYKGNAEPKNWMDAFFMLEQMLTSKKNKRLVIFIDELPWLDTPKSGFLRAFEGFWNGWASAQDNIMLIVCGSATSWIETNIINNKGGLYKRLTYDICLQPFSLNECEQLYDSLGIQLNRFDILESYMVLGGIPYYMGYMSPGKSLAQNIDDLFFSNNAKLKSEFNVLFGSLFRNPEPYIAIVKLLGKRHSGYSRDEIIDGSGQREPPVAVEWEPPVAE